MRPQLLKVSSDLIHSFSVRRDLVPDINNHWHYHSEVELIFFKKGHGTQFIGDNIRHFKEGDIVLIGSNLPHFCKFDDEFFSKHNAHSLDVIVIHFNELFWGQTFLGLNELTEIRAILQVAKRGILIGKKNQLRISELMGTVFETSGTRKIINLLTALLSIAESGDHILLSSLGFRYELSGPENNRMNAIYNYSIGNFKNKIHIKEISAVANLSPNSFCKYFKTKTQKTYANFLNEIRVSNACKMLIENRLPVKAICSESGFKNFASFYRFFKMVTGKTPLSYQKTFMRER